LRDYVPDPVILPGQYLLAVQQFILATVNGGRCSLLHSFWSLDPWEMTEAILSSGKVARALPGFLIYL